jgi:hypothetical protein
MGQKGRPGASVMSKVGRNDPCPCGSGKKFKRRCLERMDAEERSARLQAESDGLAPRHEWRFAAGIL